MGFSSLFSFMVAAGSITASALPSELVSRQAGGGYRASITGYGTGDPAGSSNCATPAVACGATWLSPSLPEAAISENLYGATSGQGAGPQCGSCWKVTADNGNSVVVRANNLCPAATNQLCSMPNLFTPNAQTGAAVHFDLCIDDGAAGAIFGRGNNGFVMGYATATDCSSWVAVQ